MAQINLGLMYASGIGVSEDDAEAVKWYRKAAEQGHASAQNNLGHKYVYGEGAPVDYVEAYAWFNIAAAQGHEDAEVNKNLVAEQMTRDGLARAQKLAREYWEVYVLPFRD